MKQRRRGVGMYMRTSTSPPGMKATHRNVMANSKPENSAQAGTGRTFGGTISSLPPEMTLRACRDGV